MWPRRALIKLLYSWCLIISNTGQYQRDNGIILVTWKVSQRPGSKQKPGMWWLWKAVGISLASHHPHSFQSMMRLSIDRYKQRHRYGLGAGAGAGAGAGVGIDIRNSPKAVSKMLQYCTLISIQYFTHWDLLNRLKSNRYSFSGT